MKNKLFKKIVAIGMAATMLLGMGLVSCAEESTPTITGARFYAFYDADDDGVDEWAPAPYGMDDGNILGVTQNGDTVTLTLGVGTYNIEMGILGTVNMTGYLSQLDGANIDVTYDETYSPDMVNSATVSISKAQNWNGMLAYPAVLSAKKNIGKLGANPPGKMGTEMEVYLVLEQ